MREGPPINKRTHPNLPGQNPDDKSRAEKMASVAASLEARMNAASARGDDAEALRLAKLLNQAKSPPANL